MRVLCLDVTGVLGGVPSPALLPEYGENFFHLPSLTRDEDDNMLTDFLHVGEMSEKREVWCLWKPGVDRQEIELLTRRLLERFAGRDEIEVFHLLVESVASGAMRSAFFDANRTVPELRYCAEFGEGRANWKTVLLGILGAEGFKHGQHELAVALALRFWMNRSHAAQRWPEASYRLLFSLLDEYGESRFEATLESMLSAWASVFVQLRGRAEHERERQSDSVFLPPASGLARISIEATPSKWPALFAWLGQVPGCLSLLSRDADSENVRNWVTLIFGKLGKAIEQGFSDVDRAFNEERSRLFGFRQQAAMKLQKTPWAAVADFEVEMKQFDALEKEGTTKADLLESLANDQRISMRRLFDAIRTRPSLLMVLLWVQLAALMIGGLCWFHEPLSQSLVGAYDGWVWYLGGAVIFILALIWALYWCQVPVRMQAQSCVLRVKDRWRQSGSAFQQYLAKQDRTLMRIVLAQNLDVARKEMHGRNQCLAQLNHHINQLARYYLEYSGKDIASASAVEANLPFDEALPDGESSLYRWSGPGASVKLSGYSQSAVPLAMEALLDSRLAGLYSIQVACIDPRGRTQFSTEGV